MNLKRAARQIRRTRQRPCPKAGQQDENRVGAAFGVRPIKLHAWSPVSDGRSLKLCRFSSFRRFAHVVTGAEIRPIFQQLG